MATTHDTNQDEVIGTVVQTLIVITIYLVTALALAGLSILFEQFVHLW